MRRRKIISTVLSLTIAATAILSGCGSTASSSAQAGSSGASSVVSNSSGAERVTSGSIASYSTGSTTGGKSVAMVFPGEVTDEAFNQYTYEGLVQAQDELGIKTAYREDVGQDEQLEVIRQFAQQGYDIVIGQGGQFGDALSQAAEEFPDKQFIFSVATDNYGLQNMTAATLSYAHAGYLAGIMAAYATTNKKVAFVTGEWYDPHKQMRQEFEDAVKSVDPSIETTAVTTGSWSDVSAAREASLSLISEGYDVLFFCLDAAYVGVISAAQDSDGVKVIGGVVDAAETAPDVTVGSVVFNWKELGYEEATGQLEGGKSYVLGMAEGGITPVVNDLSDEGKAAVEAAEEGLKDGTLNIAP